MTMHLSGTIMEIWPFEVLRGRLFQEQRLVVGQSSILRTPLHHVRNVEREEKRFRGIGLNNLWP